MQKEIYKKEGIRQNKGQLNIGIIGLGNMGSAMIKGLLGNTDINANINVSNGTRERTREKLGDRLFENNIHIAENNLSVVSSSDIIFISLKQKQMKEELNLWKEQGILTKDKTVILVSFAAGIMIGTIKKWLGNKDQPVVRVMPNTPAAVGKGVFGWSVSDEVTLGQMKQLKKLFAGIGTEIFCENEGDLDIITALSGSGPAIIFKKVEEMINASVEMGLEKDKADKAGRQALIGAGALLEAYPDISLEQLRKNITSEGGTTAAGIKTLDELGFEAIVKACMHSARDRSRELGLQFENM